MVLQLFPTFCADVLCCGWWECIYEMIWRLNGWMAGSRPVWADWLMGKGKLLNSFD